MQGLVSILHKFVAEKSVAKPKHLTDVQTGSSETGEDRAIVQAATLDQLLAKAQAASAEIGKYSTGTGTISKFCRTRDQLCLAISRGSLEELKKIADSDAFAMTASAIHKDLPSAFAQSYQGGADNDLTGTIKTLLLNALLKPPYEAGAEVLLNSRFQTELLQEAIFFKAYIRYLFDSPINYLYAGEGNKHAAFYNAALKSMLALAGSCKASDFATFSTCFVECNPGHLPICNQESLRDTAIILRQITTLILPEHREDIGLGPLRKSWNSTKIRLGLIRQDFLEDAHNLLLPVHQLDRSKFEVMIFAFDRAGLEQCRNRYPDLQYEILDGSSVNEAINAIRGRKLDILIAGSALHGLSCQPLIRMLQKKVALVQCLWLADLITSGMKTVDLLLLGDVQKGKGFETQFSEELAFLEGSGCPPGEGWQLKSMDKARENLQMRKQEIVYVNTSNIFEISPEALSVWLRIVKSVDGSRLVLTPFPVPAVMSKYRRRLWKVINHLCEEIGISPGRITLFEKKEVSAMHNLIDASDIFLDGISCSGRSETMNALLGGKPVVALAGNLLRTSFSAGILQSVKLNELIAKDIDDYIAKSVRLGHDTKHRQQTNEKILALSNAGGAMDLAAVSSSLEKSLTHVAETILPAAIIEHKADIPLEALTKPLNR